jgi:tetratricopeptide (TPR) repeat protein
VVDEGSVKPHDRLAVAKALQDGRDFEAKGLLAQAEERYAQADQLGSGEGAAQLGVLLFERREVGQAEAALRRADERRHPVGTFRLGFLLQNTGRIDEAILVYRRAAALGDMPAMNNLAVLSEERGDIAGARAMNERIIADGTNPPEVERARRRLARLGAGPRVRPRAPEGFDPVASVHDSLMWIAGDPADDSVVRARLFVLAHLDPPLRQDLAAVIRAIDQGTVDPAGTTMAPYISVLLAGAGISRSAGQLEELRSRAPQMTALLAPTSDQGPEGDAARSEFARWALAAGNAAYDASRGDEALSFLESAANIAEIVVGHRPQNLDAVRLGVETTLAWATALMNLQRLSEAWARTDRAIPIAERWAELDPRNPAPQVAISRMSAILGYTGIKVRPQPAATVRHPDRPSEAILLDSAHFFGMAAVAQAQAALDLDPANSQVRQQVGQEAWHLGRHLASRPAIPGLDQRHYAQVVVAALAPTADEQPWLQSRALALDWANDTLAPSTPGT